MEGDKEKTGSSRSTTYTQDLQFVVRCGPILTCDYTRHTYYITCSASAFYVSLLSEWCVLLDPNTLRCLRGVYLWCVYMKLHITTQSGPVILVILYHSPPKWEPMIRIAKHSDQTLQSVHTFFTCTYLSPEYSSLYIVRCQRNYYSNDSSVSWYAFILFYRVMPYWRM